MSDLIELATRTLESKYVYPIHTVAAALRTTSGEVVTAVNIDHFLGLVCAETAALTIAMNDGEYSFEEIVAVRKADDGTVSVVDLCGKCRQILHDYAPGVSVITTQGRRSIDDLIPLPFTRQQEKIKNALSG